MKAWWVYAVAALATVTAVVLYPTLSSDYSNRSKVSLVLMEQKDIKDQIEVYLTEAKPRPFTVQPYDHKTFHREVRRDGSVSIHIWGIDVDLLLTPRVVGSSVTWTCSSNKPRDVPPECKSRLP